MKTLKVSRVRLFLSACFSFAICFSFIPFIYAENDEPEQGFQSYQQPASTTYQENSGTYSYAPTYNFTPGYSSNINTNFPQPDQIQAGYLPQASISTVSQPNAVVQVSQTSNAGSAPLNSAEAALSSGNDIIVTNMINNAPADGAQFIRSDGSNVQLFDFSKLNSNSIIQPAATSGQVNIPDQPWTWTDRQAAADYEMGISNSNPIMQPVEMKNYSLNVSGPTTVTNSDGRVYNAEIWTKETPNGIETSTNYLGEVKNYNIEQKTWTEPSPMATGGGSAIYHYPIETITREETTTNFEPVDIKQGNATYTEVIRYNKEDVNANQLSGAEVGRAISPAAVLQSTTITKDPDAYPGLAGFYIHSMVTEKGEINKNGEIDPTRGPIMLNSDGGDWNINEEDQRAIDYYFHNDYMGNDTNAAINSISDKIVPAKFEVQQFNQEPITHQIGGTVSGYKITNGDNIQIQKPGDTVSGYKIIK